jgi:cytochrome c biogenesis factor
MRLSIRRPTLLVIIALCQSAALWSVHDVLARRLAFVLCGFLPPQVSEETSGGLCTAGSATPFYLTQALIALMAVTMVAIVVGLTRKAARDIEEEAEKRRQLVMRLVHLETKMAQRMPAEREKELNEQ